MTMTMQVWAIDFGSQYTQLITRRTRELGYSCEVISIVEARQRLEKGFYPHALVLSGGPRSLASDTVTDDYGFLFERHGLPILGICYGMQLIGRHFGGEVARGETGEYGHTNVQTKEGLHIPGIPAEMAVWMGHGDHVARPPRDFVVLMEGENGYLASIKHRQRPILALQFHPEVEHTPHGPKILQHFYKEIARLTPDWTPQSILEEALASFRPAREEGGAVLCAFSGGVDSLVSATVAQRALGSGDDDAGGRLKCFFVDHGLLRPQDHLHIEALRRETSLSIEVIDAKEFFYDRLQSLRDPEEKRKAIGKAFIEVFEKKAHQYERERDVTFEYLLQGTLYPDVIESMSPFKGSGGQGQKSVSATIKSHHNVGGLPEHMKLKLLEPLRWLFKDEVRQLGEQLALKREWIYRHPFPGPGLGIRVLGELSEESLEKVRRSDQILFEELKRHGIYDDFWQAFTVLLPVKTVGVKGDARAYEEVIALRLVNSTDGMTANWAKLPHRFLSIVSSRMANEIPGVTRVVYDITSKPPGTIEWE